jgi:hypothetical protein
VKFVPNVVLFMEIAPHDSAPTCRPLPWSSQNPARATSGPFDLGGASMRILNTASASFLLAAANKSTSLDKMSY